MKEEVNGDGEAEDDDDGAEDAVGDAAGVPGAGIAADGAGDQHEPAVAPLHRASEDEGDGGNGVGDGGHDHFEGVDFGDALDAAEGEGGHGEQTRSGAEVANVVADEELESE